jgi:UDP:flavonoid glycosyltransferase YjiC (YdhE family)
MAAGRSGASLRVLFTFAGGIGHFAPLWPIARDLAGAGHVVAFGAQPALLKTVDAAGFVAFETGGSTFRADHVRAPLLRPDPEREYRAISDGYAGRIARERAPAIMALCDRWKPDLLVCDEMDFGAMVAAERHAVPYATMLVIASGLLARYELIAGPLNELRAAHGLPCDAELTMLSRHLVLSPFPPSLRDPGAPLPATARVFRPLRSTARDEVGTPTWLETLPKRPTVYLTLGTVFNVESGDLLQRLLEGLRDLPINLVMTVGAQIDPAELGPQPANVRVER